MTSLPTRLYGTTWWSWYRHREMLKHRRGEIKKLLDTHQMKSFNATIKINL